MHTVVETPGYLAAAKTAGMSDDVRFAIVSAVGREATLGELMVGTGGLRNSGLHGLERARAVATASCRSMSPRRTRYF